MSKVNKMKHKGKGITHEYLKELCDAGLSILPEDNEVKSKGLKDIDLLVLMTMGVWEKINKDYKLKKRN